MSTDVCISFDTTGSMSPCIAEVRRRVGETVNKLFDTIPDLRMSIISHGDYCDGSNMIDILNFTSNKDEIVQFIKNTPNTSGGDSDEFYEYVMNQVRRLDWKADNKVFMLIGDANPHPVKYKYGPIIYLHDWEEEAEALASNGISIYPVQALGRTGSTPFYKKLATFGNGKKVDLNQFTDAVETIIAVCYHKVGRLEEYKEELQSTFKLNRNLANVLQSLGTEVTVEYVYKKDKSELVSVDPARFQIVHVDRSTDIKSFVQSIGARFRIGRGFYQFTKSELVQEHKEVVLRNKLTGEMFTGSEAREYIGLPYGVRGNIRPHYFEDYEVYIQSTSSNRKLVGGTKFLYENEV